MARWELCHIESQDRTEVIHLEVRDFKKFIAVADTVQGRQVIDATQEIEFTRGGDLMQFVHARDNLESTLRGKLLAQGWEPIGGDQFRRQVS